ncbi:MAG: hypothetical protein KDD11_14035, partial [Acidobacteria bacterium]|nr:hypothetical protein [Acidobacteriota bacterium]
MYESDENHLDPTDLVQLLWLAAPCEGASRSLAHLLAVCTECWCPEELDEEERAELAEAHFVDESLAALLWRLLAGSSPALGAKLGHLLEGCPECWRLAEPLFRPRGPRLTPDQYPELVQRFTDLTQLQRAEVARETREAPALLRRLLAEPVSRRALLVQNSARYRSAALVDALGEESRRKASRDPQAARDLAELALEIAASLDERRYGPRILEDLKALAQAYRGNAYRAAQDLVDAKDAFRKSRNHLEAGSGLVPIKAEIDSLEASLMAALRRFPEAGRLLEEARVVFRDLGEDGRLARVLVQAAKVSREAGDGEEACRLVAEALEHIDTEAEPRLLLCALQNRLVSLIDLGRFHEAEAQLAEVRTLAERLANDTDLLHVRWAEAEIAAGTGRHARAEAAYTVVRDELRAQGLLVDLGLASLQLAVVYLDEGRLDQVRPVLEEAHALLTYQGIKQDAQAARLLLAEVIRAEQISQAA